jgi:hypothetical protein
MRYHRVIGSISWVALAAFVLGCPDGSMSAERSNPPSGALDSSSSRQISLDEILDSVARGRGNRLQRLPLSDTHNVPCPHVAALIYSSGGGVGVIVPNFEMEGAALLPEEGEGKKRSAATFLLTTLSCRFTIAATKFALHDGIESEIPLGASYSGPAALTDREQTKKPIENSPSSAGISAQGATFSLNVKRIDPDLVGTTELFRSFALSEPMLTFSGMAWFGPKNFSVYVAGVPEDLRVETRSNGASKTLELDLVNAKARIRISIKKDVLVGNSWVTEFGE